MYRADDTSLFMELFGVYIASTDMRLVFSEIFFFAVQDMLTVTRNEEKKLEKQNPHRGRVYLFILFIHCVRIIVTSNFSFSL